MLYSRDWLSQYVELPASAEEVGERATAIGFAVEAIDEITDDVVLDLEVNPNRPDCMNHLGLARELATAAGSRLRRPTIDYAPEVEAEESADIRVEIEDAVGCPRYAAVVVRGIEVAPSPQWLAKRLEAVGVRPINNIVDITNFVLWEYGQPLHAFDLDRLAGGRVIVRRARPGEQLVTLDGETRTLDPEVLVIADEDGCVALAGIMGGATSEVMGETTDVLIESAHFAPTVVRRGARQLGMHTDASHRFERGSDSEACLEAALRAATLMAELAGGKLPDIVVDCRKESPWTAFGTLSLDKLDAFAGEVIPIELVEKTFPSLGFVLEEVDERTFRVGVPSWRRFDLELDDRGEVYPAHFYEEALRFFGYERVRQSFAESGALVQRYRTDRYWLTLRTIVFTVLLALPVPIVFWWLARLLGPGQGSTELGRALAVGLAWVAPSYLTLAFLRTAAKPKYLGEAHFRWPARRMAILRTGWPVICSV